MGKFISGGMRREVVQFTPTVDVAAGDVVVVADRAMVAPHAVMAGSLGVLDGGGIWHLPKRQSEEWLQSETVYWDSIDQCATTEFDGVNVARNFYLGSAAESVDRGEDFGAVELGATPNNNLLYQRLVVEQIENTRMYPKDPSEAWVYDELVYLNALGKATTVAAGNTLLGRAARAVAADPLGIGSDLGRVYLGA